MSAHTLSNKIVSRVKRKQIILSNSLLLLISKQDDTYADKPDINHSYSQIDLWTLEKHNFKLQNIDIKFNKIKK